jgi:hypothetical protein
MHRSTSTMPPAFARLFEKVAGTRFHRLHCHGQITMAGQLQKMTGPDATRDVGMRHARSGAPGLHRKGRRQKNARL